MPFEGHCLCGAVHYQAAGPAVFMGNCYCTDCRRESGSGHITGVGVPAPTLQVTGETRHFDKPADSGGSIRGVFCPTCGTTLYTLPSNIAGIAVLRAGTLDDPTAVVPQMNLYAASAPAWDRPPQNIVSFPGMPPR